MGYIQKVPAGYDLNSTLRHDDGSQNITISGILGNLIKIFIRDLFSFSALKAFFSWSALFFDLILSFDKTCIDFNFQISVMPALGISSKVVGSPSWWKSGQYPKSGGKFKYD